MHQYILFDILYNANTVLTSNIKIGRAVRLYVHSAMLLHYRVHSRVRSVTTYITAVAELHKPLLW